MPPPFGPISRRKLGRRPPRRRFASPFTGSDHEIMIRGDLSLRIPNPHAGDVGKHLLAEILKQAGISRKEWEKL